MNEHNHVYIIKANALTRAFSGLINPTKTTYYDDKTSQPITQIIKGIVKYALNQKHALHAA